MSEARIVHDMNGLKGLQTPAVMGAVADGLLAEIDLAFDAQEDPYGEAWKPLAPITKELRRGDGNRAQILQDTGILKSSLFHRVEPGHFFIGTNLEYAATHQYGATIKPKNAPRLFLGVLQRGAKRIPITANQVTIPARPFLPEQGRIPESWERSIFETLTAMIKQVWRK